MTSWIDCGVREDETVLVYFKGTSLAAMAEGLSAQQRPPFAYGNDTEPGDWGVFVHHMFNRDDYDEIDYRELCPSGAELMVFVPNPCVAKAHGPKAYHYKDGQVSSCIDYEEQLTQLICDHMRLPALDRDTITVDRDLVASYY